MNATCPEAQPDAQPDARSNAQPEARPAAGTGARPDVTADGAATPVQRESRAAARRRIARQLLLEFALPLGGYYGLVGAGLSPWAALTVSGLLALPWLVAGMVRNRRVEAMPLFTLALVAVGALMSLVTGDPRVLLIRDGWVTAVVGLWVLGTVPTRRPFMLTAARSIVEAKVGRAGAQEWLRRWDHEPVFRRQIRLLSTVWGAGFFVDSLIRVVLAYTLPLAAVPLVGSLQWLVVLGGLFVFHYQYVTRNGLKV
jgi:hypothetical protein